MQNQSEKNLQKYVTIEAFAKAQGIDFYPAGTGIGHQIMCDEGYVFPGTMVVASDSHANMYGGLGCLGTPVVRDGCRRIVGKRRNLVASPAGSESDTARQTGPGVSERHRPRFVRDLSKGRSAELCPGILRGSG
ncbi:MAG: aconitase family protein [Candidatus Marinimicrobia bacterium]|nr:aconitase family protein [Candidatus Neomarinimicrobiota bacterium]